MSKLRFCLIGDGAIAEYHKKAIEHVGGELDTDHIIDPKYKPDLPQEFSPNRCFAMSSIYKDLESAIDYNVNGLFDYIVICSPSYLHRLHIQKALNHSGSVKIIVEKPAFLPWEPIIESDQLNIVLQLRYLPNLPKSADLVTAHFLRDDNYFYSWKGDPKKTGGLFYNLFIHYLDLAQRLGANFEGSVNLTDDELPKFFQSHDNRREPLLYRRYISYRVEDDKPPGGHLLNIIDLQKVDMQQCYNNMYEDIISGGGVKPKDLFYLNWILQRNSEMFGYGRNGMNKLIRIGKELL